MVTSPEHLCTVDITSAAFSLSHLHASSKLNLLEILLNIIVDGAAKKYHQDKCEVEVHVLYKVIIVWVGGMVSQVYIVMAQVF